MRSKAPLALTLPLLVASCDLQAKIGGNKEAHSASQTQRAVYHKRGIASWYGRNLHGRRTASGEVFDLYDLTAAHPSLPLGTYVKVTNLNNGRSIVVKINDRLPACKRRLIDLSYAAAYRLKLHKTGLAPVEIQAL
jgi:rare lipoprotein A